ncbi:MAG: hypothetical protein ETSY1_28925 [Candidatus Entotheonella factor]|uniref:VWFA domain-containing protein n=1 Tax=Entotheonella factor TaxID=1429438 RepID=W4LCQ8_ENTF1|nr:VWA domain-containing protein [Candidatus Entotheonella palauensis]ETW95853.1 MAG: hypothetical protein ETSY1_28925 [Candidatus Entotheonella factor]
MMQLTHPAWLLIGILLIAPYFVRPRRAWQYASLQLLPAQTHLGWTTWLTMALMGSAFLLLLLALANPQKTAMHSTETVQARDIVLTLDLSLSMESRLPSSEQLDLQNKLDLIQQASLRFVEQSQRDRIGLLVFGDDAFGAWPLSLDTTTLRVRLQHLGMLIPVSLRGTNVGKALVKSLDHMQERGQAQTKVIIILTDGLDTIAPEMAEAILQRLRDQNVELYVLGIALSPTASIIQLSQQAQGQYFDISKADDLDAAFQSINQLTASRVLVAQELEPELLYPFFLIPGLLLLLTSMVCKTFWVLEI